jgi:hypothetical protein
LPIWSKKGIEIKAARRVKMEKVFLEESRKTAKISFVS